MGSLLVGTTLKDNKIMKVKIESIISCQGEDYNQLCQELDPDYDPMGSIAAWINEDSLIEYFLQWYYPGEHDTNIYDANGINTEFLGYEKNIDQDIFLLSHNSSIGYAGLSRIIEYIKD